MDPQHTCALGDVHFTHPRLVFGDGEEPAVEAVGNENSLQRLLLFILF